PPPSDLEAQRALAAQPGPDRTLETVRLASLALRVGETDEAERALRAAVVQMQDFRAEGEVRAMVGAERTKEWKGDPFEKMMAFQYLGLLLFEQGDYGNTLAMTKSAVLADTGTSQFQYRADFVPAFVLQALAYERIGEPNNAQRSMTQAVDAMYVRELTALLSSRLGAADPSESPGAGSAGPRGVDAARVLLLSGLPAGLLAHPRDPEEAISGALSRATDLRALALDSPKRSWPEDLRPLRRRDVDRAFDALEPLVVGWREAVARDGAAVSDQVAGDARTLEELVTHPPRLVLWVEDGVGPSKVATGRYGEILRIVPRSEPREPELWFDGAPVAPAYLDSLTYQASTRGGRWVDGFLKGKAAFKDAAPFVGWALVEAGDVASQIARDSDDQTVALALYAVGAAVWIAGAATNPAADTRAWDDLPETLWLVALDPAPGPHELRVDGRVVPIHVGEQPTSVLVFRR
ncbi:MAG: hypothetical protein ABMA64_05225, partial [Myxococcota bacterium]